MSDLDVGKRATRITTHGEEAVCDILGYEAGRDAGDHYVFGGNTPKEKNSGQGDVFSGWVVVGHEGKSGTIRIH